MTGTDKMITAGTIMDTAQTETDPNTLKGLNEEEIEHIRKLENERPHLFGLPGEKLRATYLVTHKLITTTDTPIRVKRHRTVS